MNNDATVNNAHTESKVMPTVCVTGASGFIASHLVKQLLDQGYTVRGSVRGAASNYPYLTSLEGATERLQLFQADLLKEGAFEKIVDGCEFVLHTASPYIVNVKDSQTELVDPAVNGTLNVLKACAKTDSVKRVVVTSSLAAITDEPDSTKVFSEVDWNEKSNLKRNPYFYSKVEAEKAAWSFVKNKQDDCNFELVTINPFMVIGPSLGPGLNESNKILSDLLKGAYPCLMTVNWGIVDVRDVAAAHILAMTEPTAKGRYLIVNENWTMAKLVSFMRDELGYSDYRLPKLNLATPFGDKVMKLLSYTQPSGNGTYMRSHVGRKMQFDNSKAVDELHIKYIPAAQSIQEAVEDMVRWKHLPVKDSTKAIVA
jgi:nucleoside-diphosphate-sugar epimerase